MGIWRLIESLDRHGIRASVMLNSDVGERCPQIIEAGRARDWAWGTQGPVGPPPRGRGGQWPGDVVSLTTSDEIAERCARTTAGQPA
ncbi:hypothetical protein [Streptomyces noursei]|uniref:hypothetical protein n=1 Tax=Streptomyces noursei TaxID=1971 RepID=UPI0037FFEC88